MENALVDINEAARILGKHRNTVSRWAAAGQLPVAVRSAGGSPRFRRSDLEALMGSAVAS